MTRFPASILFATIILLAVGFAAPPAAAQYVYTPIPGPSGNSYVQAVGVNDSGTVVGFYSDSAGHSHGFLWTGGTNYTTFDFPGAVGTFPYGINNAGVIVGTWSDSSGFCHAFSGTIGNFTTLNIFGSPQTYANAINNKGEIVGAWEDANSIIHGFTDINGTFSSFDFPGSPVVTFPLGVNDLGQIVGSYTPSGQFPTQSFILNSDGTITTLALPDGSPKFGVGGIDDGGDLVGNDSEKSPGGPLVVAGGGIVNALAPFGFSSGFLFGLNSSQISSSGEDIVGNVNGEGFLGRGPSLLDPVPDMLDLYAPAVENDAALATGPGSKGRPVKAVAADGVTEAVIRIPTQNAGDQFTITLFSDQAAQSDSPSQDGALGNPGDTSFTQSQITVTAENVTVTAADGSTSQVPFAFAVYHAPIDFVREPSPGSYLSGMCPFHSGPTGFSATATSLAPPGPTAAIGNNTQTDDQLACRMVTLQIQDLSQNTTSNVPVAILRPPVVMIHGLWDNWKTWNNFNPLVQGPNNVDKRFSIGRVSYDAPIGPLIVDSDPPYHAIVSAFAESNSLGFAFNAVLVQQQTDGWIGRFEDGENPMHLPAAAVQADIVAHSMGGVIARTMALQTTFLGNSTYDQGTIHKLITIDTPHLGSQLAPLLLSPGEEVGCVEDLLSLDGKFVFNTVELAGFSQPISGAMQDLTPGSQALSSVASSNSHQLPTALIAGVYTQFASLTPTNSFIGGVCSLAQDPLARDLTPTGWPAIFSGENNDAIVSETSQLNGLISPLVFQNRVHSPGTEHLGFSPPSVLDPDFLSGVPSTVISLLNTPVNFTSSTSTPFVFINP